VSAGELPRAKTAELLDGGTRMQIPKSGGLLADPTLAKTARVGQPQFGWAGSLLDGPTEAKTVPG